MMVPYRVSSLKVSRFRKELWGAFMTVIQARSTSSTEATPSVTVLLIAPNMTFATYLELSFLKTSRICPMRLAKAWSNPSFVHEIISNSDFLSFDFIV